MNTSADRSHLSLFPQSFRQQRRHYTDKSFVCAVLPLQRGRTRTTSIVVTNYALTTNIGSFSLAARPVDRGHEDGIYRDQSLVCIALLLPINPDRLAVFKPHVTQFLCNIPNNVICLRQGLLFVETSRKQALHGPQQKTNRCNKCWQELSCDAMQSSDVTSYAGSNPKNISREKATGHFGTLHKKIYQTVLDIVYL